VASFRFQVLGPIECLAAGEQRLDPGDSLAVKLLALLLLRANQPVPSEVLIDGLWGAGPAERRLEAAIVRLRTAIGDGLEPVSGGYRLRVGARELDADAFAARVVHGRRALGGGEPLLAGELLANALAMWRGPAYAEVAQAPFAADAIRRLDALRTDAVALEAEARRRIAGPAAIETIDSAGTPRSGARNRTAVLVVQQERKLLDPARQLTIGRSSSSDIALTWDQLVSRTHALLACVGGAWVISDDGLSSNGTFCNGRRVRGLLRLEDGDILRLGGTLIVFRYELEPATRSADAEDATVAA
jgi:hypothetical protein